MRILKNIEVSEELNNKIIKYCDSTDKNFSKVTRRMWEELLNEMDK